MARVFAPLGRWWNGLTRLQLGALWLVVTLISGYALLNKSEILLRLRSGDTIAAEFSSRYKLQRSVSKVEISGVRVGTITGVEPASGGGARVEMKLDHGVVDKLGREPAAAIRPATFLGGPGLSAYVELTPGGRPGRFAGDTIPQARTRIPVELDRVLEVLDDDARRGMATGARGLDTALTMSSGDTPGPPAGGGEALGNVLDDAPAALRPTAGGVGAMVGEDPGDLARLVRDLGALAAVLTETDGELESVVDDMAVFARTLGDRRVEMAEATTRLPATLKAARAGLAALERTLAKLEATAPAARPSVQRLGELLRRLPPVLAEARPLLSDLRPLAAEATPAFAALGPTAKLLRELLEDLDGPVLDRLNDAVIPTLLSGYGGTAPTLTTRATKLYEETAYFLAGLAGIAKYTDPSGAMVNFYVGNSEDSVSP